MKKWIPAQLLVTAALVIAAALPADAATTSISVAAGTGPASVDTSTKLVYVGTTPPSPSAPANEWTSSAGVAQIDPVTKKVVKAVTISTLLSYVMSEYVSDVKVNPTTNDLWVLTGGVAVGGCWSTLYQLHKKTLAKVRSYKLGCARKIELDPTSQWAYLAEAPFYNDLGENAQPVTKGNVVAIDGATGTVSRAIVPSPTSGVFSITEGHRMISIAFNRKNYGLYVVGQGTMWAYTNKLKLVHTTKLSYSPDSVLKTAANLTTNQIYITDGVKVTEISGVTGEITRTSVVGGGSTMVIDTSSNVLYLGTNTINLSTFTSTGKQAYLVQAVDPSTHARYWAGSATLNITR